MLICIVLQDSLHGNMPSHLYQHCYLHQPEDIAWWCSRLCSAHPFATVCGSLKSPVQFTIASSFTIRTWTVMCISLVLSSPIASKNGVCLALTTLSRLPSVSWSNFSVVNAQAFPAALAVWALISPSLLWIRTDLQRRIFPLQLLLTIHVKRFF